MDHVRAKATLRTIGRVFTQFNTRRLGCTSVLVDNHIFLIVGLQRLPGRHASASMFA